jgi:hypothetical protein
MVEVGVPKRTPLNQFDFIVDTFSECIGPAFHKIVQDEFEPVFRGHQKSLESGHSLFFNLLDPNPTQQCGSGFFTVSNCFKDRAEPFFQLMADLQFG